MRLYLSSYELGNYQKELLELAGENNKRAAIIANAADGYGNTEERSKRVAKEIDNFTDLGFIPEELDLRKYFGNPKKLQEVISQFGLVWVRGGNSFILKRAFEQSGFDTIIKEMLARDEIVYGGYSAGIVILSPSMKGLEIVDDPNVVPDGYAPEFNWDGLGLVRYSIAVHYRSNHPESAMVEKEVEYLEKNQIPYKTLRDGEVIIINDDKEEILDIA